jgi:hypothetical protein
MWTISDDTLLKTFGTSPVGFRKIRKRLNSPPKSVVLAVLHSAIKRGIIRKVSPIEVGYGGSSIRAYVPIKRSEPVKKASLYSRFF